MRDIGAKDVSLLLVTPLVAALTFGAGCSRNSISVKATSEDRDIFQNPEGEKDGAMLRGPDEAPAPGRAPFVNLSTYNWDYADWLADLRDSIVDLRLPDSTETRVELYFMPGSAAPIIRVECDAAPAECARLTAQVGALAGLPRLPADFRDPELVAILSRLP